MQMINKECDHVVILGRGQRKSEFLRDPQRFINRMNEIKMDIRLRIGQQIADLRAQNKMTQQDLADAAGVSRTHLTRIETGKYAVKLDVLDKIATALGVRIELIND